MPFLQSTLYAPDSKDYQEHPSREGFEFSEFQLPSDSASLHGWHGHAVDSQPRATVLQFHGNAANITNHWGLLKWAPPQGFDAIAFDYRGFGRSTGRPNLARMQADCRAVLQFAVNDPRIRTEKLILLGQSLGGYLCMSALDEIEPERIAGVILDSTFYDVDGLVRHTAAGMVSKFLAPAAVRAVTGGIEPLKVEAIDLPAVVLHAEEDPIVPYAFGRQLSEAWGGPKQFISLPGDSHLGYFAMAGKREIAAFCERMDDHFGG